jgi:uncharacterized iron-regulated protein
MSGAAAAAQPCLTAPGWYTLEATAPKLVAAHDILSEMARRDVVLLGEHHDDADHHRWQLQTLAALLPLRPRMLVGFEAFPRRVQPALDRWVAGALNPKEFLARSEWQKVWNLPPELYMPLFEFARLNRIPMLALNVERRLTSAVREKGWDAVPAELREGVSRPAPASRAYEDWLFEVFAGHEESPKRARTRDDPAFRSFVQSQTTWDRAMAEAIASRLKGEAGARPLVVGIMGAGHVRHGYGVAHQLRDLGITSVGALLPSTDNADCKELPRGLADAVFAVPRDAREAPPRLGVRLEPADGAVRVAAVDAGSLGERSGLKPGDQIVTIAGKRPTSASSVATIVRDMPPGTWLPLQLRRGESSLELVIKFPPD